MKTKKLLLLIFLLGIIISTQAQQRPVYSQYMFNALAINPAFAGSQDQFSATALYRNQWVNLPGSPETYTLSANTAFAAKKVGLGFVLTNDKIAIHDDLGLYLSYAYRIKFRGGALAFGLQAGFNNLKSDYDKLVIKDINDPYLRGVRQTFSPNFGAGVFYSTSSTYIGVSIPYLINSKISSTEEFISQAKSRRYYFINAGHVYKLTSDFKFKPSTLIRFQEKAPLGVDINLQLIYKDMISIGNSYRSGDADILNIEFQLNENLRIGYAYEVVLSNLGGFNQGSHEIMINYRINIPGLQRSVECPSYF